MYIPRHIEPVVTRISKRKPVLVLTGARQVGKSTMLKSLLGDIKYITLNHPLTRLSAKENPGLFFDMHKPPVVVDEIQKAAGLFDYIKDMVDSDKKTGQFFLTGSQSIKLMKDIGDSLAGRAGVIKLLGLSMREIGGVQHRLPFLPIGEILTEREKDRPENEALSGDLHEYVHKGFFPELHEQESTLHDWTDFYGSYFQTYIERDIRDVLNIQDESAFIKFVKATAAHTGQLLNLTSISRICGKDVKTVRAWMSALETRGAVFMLEPYYDDNCTRLVKTPKMYFLDTGLACWLLGWNTPEQLVNGAMWGNMFETFVVGEVLKSYYNDGIVLPPMYYYRDKDKNEIDLVLTQGETLYPIEIKATSNPTKHMTSAFRYLSGISGKTVGEGAIICQVNERLPLADGIWAVPAKML